jgi:hypothetical protein
MDDKITTALECWLSEAQITIAKQFSSLVQHIGMSRWHAQPSGSFKHYPFDAIYKYSELETAIFERSENWVKVERLAKKHKNLNRHCAEFVSSTSGSGRTYSLRELCKTMLPKLRLVDEQSIYADTNLDVKLRVRTFLEAINSESIDHTTVWPIQGLATVNPVILDELTQFRELTEKEKLHCLNFEIIRPMMQQEILAERACWFGLCRTTKDAKIFGSQNSVNPELITKRFADLDQLLEDFLVSVPLTNNRVAFHAGGISAAPHFEHGNALSFGTTGRSVGASNDIRFMFIDENTILTTETAEKLCEVWTFIRASKKGSFKKRVGNAARRLFYAETRTKHDDVLIDLMIAAESLYLNDDKNELSYRMSLNAALWADVDDADRRQIFDAFKSAYNLRSKVVHGSAATLEKLAESTSIIKPILRDGIRKALVHLNISSNAPDWESAIFASGRISKPEK